MLATQLNDMVNVDQLDKMAVFRLDKYACNLIQNRKCATRLPLLFALATDALLRIVIMLGVTLIENPRIKLGQPKSVEEDQGGGAASTSAARPAANAPARAAAAQPANAYSASARGGSSAARGGKAGGVQGRSGGSSSAPIYPIEGLSPYQNK